MKKLSTLQKWYLKYTNRNDYNQYKLDLKNIIEVEFIERTKEIKHVSLNHLYKKSTTFIHSGNSGDIIYALPSVFELSKNGKAKLYLKANQQGTYPNYHPLGGVMLNDKMIEMLIPLFAYQPQIEFCKKYEEELIDYNLDEFRKYSFLFDKGSIIRWYFQVYGITSNTSLPWLVAPKNQKYEEAIVIARSHRYRSPLINYKFLEKYSNLFFVGVKEEYDDIKNQISKRDNI